jgi:hypothetical protein
MKRFTEQATSFDAATYLLPALKTQLKITHNNADTQLLSLLGIAFVLIEKYTWRLLAERVVKGEFDAPSQSRASIGKMMLDCWRAPVFDNAFESAVWHGKNTNQALTGYIAPVMEFGECFITNEPTEEQNENALYLIDVYFKAGYKFTSTTWDCPMPLQQAIIELATFMYQNTGACNVGGCNCGDASNGIRLPSNVALMCNPFVIRRYDLAL